MNRSWPVSEEQAAVVEARDGLFTVSASAGSGKTRAVIYAILDHIADGVPGDRILAVAYNRSAAKEMKDRIVRWAPDEFKMEALETEVSTFHAFCLGLLRSVGRASEVLDDRDARRWVADILRSELRDFDSDPSEVLSTISYYREVLPGYEAKKWRNATAAAVVPYYIERMRREAAVDFTEMQAATMRLLDDNQPFRERTLRRFDLMCLDEAQDQNPLRSAIWNRLIGLTYGTRTCKTVLMVGDAEGQAIYGFAGATPEVFLGYQGLADKTMTLSRNYRSHPDIVAAGNAVLGAAVGIPTRDIDCAARPIVCTADYSDGSEEAAAVSDKIRDRIAGGTVRRDIAVIYRSRAAGADIQIALMRAGIRFVIRGGSGFFNRAPVQDAIAHLEAAATWDIEAIARAARCPTRFLGAAFRSALGALAQSGVGGPDLVDPDRYDSRQMRGVRALRNHLGAVAGAMDIGPSAALEAVYGLQGLKDATFAMSGPEDKLEERGELLATLLEVAEGFDTTEDFLAAARNAINVEISDNGETPDAVVLTTAHRAKGLEWPAVYIIGMSGGIWPHRLALNAGSEDEERRLAFVAVTRGVDHICISSRGTYFGKPALPSVYLGAIRGEVTMPAPTWPRAGIWTEWLRAGCPAGQCPSPHRGGGEI